MSSFVGRLLRHLPMLALSLGGALTAHAQTQTAPAWSTARGAGRATRHALLDAAGNSYEWGSFSGSGTVGGTTLTSRGGADAFVAKYSPTGALLWLRQIGSADADDAVDLSLDAAGNAYVVGTLGGTLDFGGATLAGPAQSGFLVCYSPQGVATWAQLISSPDGQVKRVRADNNGHVFVAGNFGSSLTAAGSTLTAAGGARLSFFVARYADTGTGQWLVPAFAYLNVANVVNQEVHMALAPGGALYLAADFDAAPTVGSTTLPPRGQQDVLLARFTAQGQPEWAQQLGGTGRETLTGLAADASGNAYLVGTFTTPFSVGSTTLTSAGTTDAYLLKVAPTGSPLWAQSGGGAGVDSFNGLSVDAGGNAYATGSFYDVAQFGGTTLTGSQTHTCAMVLAYAPQGQLRWAQQTGGAGTSAGYSVSQSSNGDLQVCGTMSVGAVSFGALSISPAATAEFFTARLNGAALTARTSTAQVLLLYPNPATDQVRLPALAAGTTVQLLDTRGRVVRTATVAAGTLSVRGLAPGLYTLRAANIHGQHYGARLAVE